MDASRRTTCGWVHSRRRQPLVHAKRPERLYLGQERQPFGKLRASLLGDGKKVYVHSQVNRPVTLTGNALIWNAVYNRDGARLRQTVNGVPPTCTITE